ncbi:MAG: FAD synthase, partial [Methanosarcinales archaeon]
VIPGAQRAEMVSALKMVDKAMLGSETDMYELLYSIKPDVIAVGYDQAFDEEALVKELRERGFNSKVVRIKKHNSNAFCKAEEIIKHIGLLRNG